MRFTRATSGTLAPASRRRARDATGLCPCGGSPCFSTASISPKVRFESVGQKQRIVTEAFLAPRRPYHDAIDAGLEFFRVTVGPGKTECGNKVCAALLGHFGAALVQQVVDAGHCGGEIFLRPGPARRMNAGLAAERFDHQPGVVGKGRASVVFAAAVALMRALSAKLAPVSCGSARLSSPADCAAMP